MNCPKCASEDWKLASVIYAGGKSKISTSTLGVGLGENTDAFGGGAGIGLVGAGTNGTQQTELSKLAAPPEKIIRPAKILAILFGGIFLVGIIFFRNTNIEKNQFLTDFFFEYVPFLLTIICFRMALTSRITNEVNDKNKKAMAEYEKKKMCLRCGTFYFSEIHQNDFSSSITDLESTQPINGTKKCHFCAETIRSDAILCKHCHSNLLNI